MMVRVSRISDEAMETNEEEGKEDFRPLPLSFARDLLIIIIRIERQQVSMICLLFRMRKIIRCPTFPIPRVVQRQEKMGQLSLWQLYYYIMAFDDDDEEWVKSSKRAPRQNYE